MTPAEFGAALNWGARVVRIGKLCWVSDSGTTVSNASCLLTRARSRLAPASSGSSVRNAFRTSRLAQ